MEHGLGLACRTQQQLAGRRQARRSPAAHPSVAHWRLVPAAGAPPWPGRAAAPSTVYGLSVRSGARRPRRSRAPRRPGSLRLLQRKLAEELQEQGQVVGSSFTASPRRWKKPRDWYSCSRSTRAGPGHGFRRGCVRTGAANAMAIGRRSPRILPAARSGWLARPSSKGTGLRRLSGDACRRLRGSRARQHLVGVLLAEHALSRALYAARRRPDFGSIWVSKEAASAGQGLPRGRAPVWPDGPSPEIAQASALPRLRDLGMVRVITLPSFFRQSLPSTGPLLQPLPKLNPQLPRGRRLSPRFRWLLG